MYLPPTCQKNGANWYCKRSFFIFHSTSISRGSFWKFAQISWWNGTTTWQSSDSAARNTSEEVILSVTPRGFSPYDSNATSIW
ncbi:Uncharacterised protein [Vibrio cholerae]|nr:Uncharacterised protein [Vibrio cholerae]CSD06469.1 Uncharacterised protein [Vibrio cholerae]